MRKIFSVLVLALNSCAGVYQYEFKMIKPQESDKLIFEDELIKADFSVNKSDISFSMKNKSSKAIKIIWDDCAFVNNGEAFKIIHKEVKFLDKEKSQVPTTIPPNSLLKDLVAPIENINMNYYYSKYNTHISWTKAPLLGNHVSQSKSYIRKYMLPMKERKLALFIPVNIDGQKHDYMFEFAINDIRIYKTKTNNKSIFETSL
ncbi:hypothetical protein BWK60_12455 [Flavobacterium covae]|uniref:hypothetical protein n=1 Tax=Flavobacterium covae TaxID=2906076 RepID=UPI000B4D3FD4|nr:hypothetical protein [Flavobacterium covae]OWP85751.1 hypothetical protein BWK60_12455 [Flavobacterium covae]